MFCLAPADDDDTLRFFVFDWDRFSKDDFLAWAEVPLDSIHAVGPAKEKVTLPLRNKKDQLLDGVELTVEVSWVRTTCEARSSAAAFPAGILMSEAHFRSLICEAHGEQLFDCLVPELQAKIDKNVLIAWLVAVLNTLKGDDETMQIPPASDKVTLLFCSSHY
jgi:hypothetical protein